MLALQALCTFDAVGDTFQDQLDDYLHDPHVHADLKFDAEPLPETIAFARDLALGTWTNRARYDRLLTQTATDWTVARMPPVDRNILRLGLHELLECPETAPEIVINEAIELARLFADKDSTAFVNAVLDANRRNLGIGQPPPPPP